MSDLRNYTILVIEDEELIRLSLVDILELNHFTVFQAVNGKAGLAQAVSIRPALIITDINMPEMGGFELLQRIAQNNDLKTIPVIVISALADRSDVRHGMELGAADYISKPFTETEVVKAVHTQLAKKDVVKELEAFAHTVAHDLKNPLATLNLRLELLERLLPGSESLALTKSMTEAQRSANRLANMIDDLLILSGVQRLQVATQPFDMAIVVDEALDQLSALLKQLKVTVEKPESWPPAVSHPPWIVHIWANFISNAVRHAAQGGRVTLGTSVGHSSAWTRYWVQDYGSGVPADELPNLFASFRAVSTVRTRRRGMGLSIVHQICEKLGSRVGAENTPGAGARFWFELPNNSSAEPLNTARTNSG
jgi:two-component system sensor histidine kinase/response regulator